MKRDNINYLMVGSFVLSMFVLLLIVLFKITGNGTNTEPYYVHFTNITGISEGTPVTYGGYHLGNVSNIEPVKMDGRTHYRLELSLKSGWKIPQDSLARITSPGLLADDLIDIEEGKSVAYLSPGGELQGQDSINMVASLNSVAHDIKNISDNSIKPLIDNLGQHIDNIGNNLNTNVPRVTDNFNKLLDSLNFSAEQLATLLSGDNQEYVENVFKNADKISHSLANLSDGFDQARDQINMFLDNANNVLTDNDQDIRASIIEMRNMMETVSTNINSIIYHLESSSRNMNEFSRQLRENPSILLNSKAPKDSVGIE